MNAFYIEAKRQLAFDPPTHMAPHEWRRLVEGLVEVIDTDRRDVLLAVATKLDERADLMRHSSTSDIGRIHGVEESADLVRQLAD